MSTDARNFDQVAGGPVSVMSPVFEFKLPTPVTSVKPELDIVRDVASPPELKAALVDADPATRPPARHAVVSDSEDVGVAHDSPMLEYDRLVEKISQSIGILGRALLVYGALRAYEEANEKIGPGKNNGFYDKTTSLTKLTKRTLQGDIKLINTLGEPLAQAILAKGEIHRERQMLLFGALAQSQDDRQRLAGLSFEQLQKEMTAKNKSSKKAKTAEKVALDNPTREPLTIEIDDELSHPVWADDVRVSVPSDDGGRIHITAPRFVIVSARAVDEDCVVITLKRSSMPLEVDVPGEGAVEEKTDQSPSLTPRKNSKTIPASA